MKIKARHLPVLLFGYFLFITLAIYIVKPAKESLFMDALGKAKLPYAFLLTALLMGVAVTIHSRLLERLGHLTLVSGTLTFFILTGILFWFFIRRPTPWPWIFLLFWSWADILLVTTITQFWIAVNDLFEPREAKKRIGFFVSGGLLGGLVGSLIVFLRPLGLETEELILICLAILAVAMAIILYLRRSGSIEAKEEKKEGVAHQAAKEKIGLISSLSVFRENRYLLYLSGMMVVAIIVSNLVDFQFKALGKTFFPDKNATASFFAAFNIALLIFSFLLAALLATRLLKKFGMRLALLIPPALLLIGSITVFLIPVAAFLLWIIAMKGVDKSLTHSLSQSVREILYIPLPAEVKYRAKVVIDMFLNKFADGLTGVVLIAVSPFLKLTPQEVSLLAIVFILVWIVINFRITREYVNIVKRNLQVRWEEADKLVLKKIDVDMTRLVFDALQSRERSSVLYAMNLFDLIKKEKMTPQLWRLLAHRENELRARSLDSLLDLEGEPLLPEFDDSLDPQELDAQAREIMSLDVYQELMKEQIERAMREKGEEAEVTKMEAAKAMGMLSRDSPLVGQLKKLLQDGSAEVARYAAESAGRLRRKELVPHLVNLLARPATREVAQQALCAYGDTIIGALNDALRDEEENLSIRKAVPEILAQAGSVRAMMALILELQREDPSVEAELIEALHRLRSNCPHFVFPNDPIVSKVISLIQKCYLLLIQLYEFKRNTKKEALARELEASLGRAMKHIFELLGLILPQEDVIRAFQNIQQGTRKAVDYSIELLDNILPKNIKELLLPLIEDRSFEEKVRFSRRMLKSLESGERT